jgi:hypothetical protein
MEKISKLVLTFVDIVSLSNLEKLIFSFVTNSENSFSLSIYTRIQQIEEQLFAHAIQTTQNSQPSGFTMELHNAFVKQYCDASAGKSFLVNILDAYAILINIYGQSFDTVQFEVVQSFNTANISSLRSESLSWILKKMNFQDYDLIEYLNNPKIKFRPKIRQPPLNFTVFSKFFEDFENICWRSSHVISSKPVPAYGMVMI